MGRAAVFNGKSYLSILDNDSLDSGQITISFWAYRTGHISEQEKMPYLYKGADEDGWDEPYELYEWADNAPKLELHENDNTSGLDQFYLAPQKPTDIRKWFLLSATFDGKEARLYENDTLIAKKSARGSISKTLGDLFIGLDSTGQYFYKGYMDDFRIYNRALSNGEITSLYNTGVKSNPKLFNKDKALVAHYKFNGNTNDSSRFKNNAKTSAGKITYVDGANGKAARFSKGTYLEVLDNTSLDFDEGFTISGWFLALDDRNFMGIINKPGSSTSSDLNDPSYRLRIYNDFYDFDYTPFDYQADPQGNRYLVQMNKSLKNKWIHLGVTFNKNEIRWYNNGKLRQKTKLPDYSGKAMAHSVGDLMIGSDGDYHFTGVIDELKLYNYALSSKEIDKNFKAVDTLSISKDSQKTIKSMRKGVSFKLDTSRKYLETGKTVKIVKDLTYKTSNKKVFTVSSKGIVKAVRKGNAILTINHGGISKQYKVTVK